MAKKSENEREKMRNATVEKHNHYHTQYTRSTRCSQQQKPVPVIKYQLMDV